MKNDEEQTALHVAAHYGKSKIISVLAEEDLMLIHHKDENNDTALHIAAKYSQVCYSAIAIIIVNLTAC